MLKLDVLNDASRQLWKEAFVVPFVEDSAPGTVRPISLGSVCTFKESSNLSLVVDSFTLAFLVGAPESRGRPEGED